MPRLNVLIPIARKELRETVGLACVAAFVACFLVSVSMVDVFPWSRVADDVIPFANDGTILGVIAVAAALAVALGLKQSAWESHTGNYLFLLHRPIAREWLMAVKIAVGVAVYAIAIGFPLLIYALWAATPGTHASPFYWSMTLPTWWGLLALIPLYLGSFVSGLGEGRWYATRLLPLAGTTLATSVLSSARTSWPVLSTGALIVVVGLLWLAIVLVSKQREYA